MLSPSTSKEDKLNYEMSALAIHAARKFMITGMEIMETPLKN